MSKKSIIVLIYHPHKRLDLVGRQIYRKTNIHLVPLKPFQAPTHLECALKFKSRASYFVLFLIKLILSAKVKMFEHCTLRLYIPYVTVKARRLVNPRIYHSEVVKVRKMLVNASISSFYQTISVNDSIYQHQLVKARFV
jgi:hypothetical protein